VVVRAGKSVLVTLYVLYETVWSLTHPSKIDEKTSTHGQKIPRFLGLTRAATARRRESTGHTTIHTRLGLVDMVCPEGRPPLMCAPVGRIQATDSRGRRHHRPRVSSSISQSLNPNTRCRSSGRRAVHERRRHVRNVTILASTGSSARTIFYSRPGSACAERKGRAWSRTSRFLSPCEETRKTRPFCVGAKRAQLKTLAV
jgi:hypothetical protein